MIELLRLGSKHGWEELKKAVEQALDPGLHGRSGGAASAGRWRTELTLPGSALQLGPLERYERPLPVMSDYDLAAGDGGGDAMKPATEALEHASCSSIARRCRFR